MGFPKCSYCHLPNTEHLVAERNCLCTSWGRAKPFHSWLLLGLPNVSPFSCLGDFFAHLSSQVVCTFHLLSLIPLLQHDLAGNDINTKQVNLEVTDDFRSRIIRVFSEKIHFSKHLHRRTGFSCATFDYPTLFHTAHVGRFFCFGKR